MLSSDRLRTPHADDHEETDDLWERLRSEANRRSSMIPAAPSQPPPARLGDYRDAFDSEPPDEELGDSDLPPSPYESAQRFVSSSYPPAQQHYGHQSYELQAQQGYAEAEQLAQYESSHSTLEQYSEHYGEQYDDESEQTEQFDSEQPEQDAYEQEEYEAQQYAAEQYNLQQLAPAQQHYGQAQYAQQQYGQQPALRTSNPPGSFGQYGQPAAYGHVQPQQAAGFAQAPGGFAQPAAQWAHQAAALPHESDESGNLRSGWTKPLVALAAVLAIGAAGYQFVLVPRQQAARAASLVELQQRQAALIEQQEKEQKEAAAKAEAEQKAANEAALARADEAAAAAAATAAATPAPTAKAGSSKAKSSDDSEERDRRRAERAERRAARAEAKAEKSEARTAKAAPVATAKPSKKKAEGGMSEADSDDPLLGL
jgi:hypothetical protein